MLRSGGLYMNQVQTIGRINPAQEYRIPMTGIEFENGLAKDRFSEWANGEAIAFMSPTPLHQRISAFLNMLLGIYMQALNLGELLYAPCSHVNTPRMAVSGNQSCSL